MIDDKILNITKDIQWIGVLDHDIVTFDIVMETKYGTTYNSYFINAEKKTVIDTAKESFKNEYLSKIIKITNPAEIEYIVFNHTEPDHSGALKDLLALAPNATVVGSGQAINYLQDITGITFKSLRVKDGDTLDLGNKSLKFIGAPNLHWPDSIYTYLQEDKVLFTCDLFGAHYCNEAMFDDLAGDYNEAFDYYFDVILKPFSRFMLKAIEKIRPLDIDTICTGHGPILRKTWKEKVARSEQLAMDFLCKEGQKDKNVLITYVSAYGFTREMAGIIKDGLLKVDGVNVKILNLEKSLLGEMDENLTLSNGVIMGSPTINQNTLLPVYRFFSIVNPIRDHGKLATAFGSYGWSGEAVKIIEANLNALKFNIVQDSLIAKFSPHDEKIDELIEFGKNFGEQLVRCREEMK